MQGSSTSPGRGVVGGNGIPGCNEVAEECASRFGQSGGGLRDAAVGRGLGDAAFGIGMCGRDTGIGRGVGGRVADIRRGVGGRFESAGTCEGGSLEEGQVRQEVVELE
ncbi:hypothetical protein L2E82_25087 [Cichorium intybus]|uniref:Uncharacterized protein n=1 Tax=Cichorium intybus TaxID=13427 RepID=A0ACB9E323_CICIN|nr:hypothetical protein L2E82_25087 [Cichorium intybus]